MGFISYLPINANDSAIKSFHLHIAILINKTLLVTSKDIVGVWIQNVDKEKFVKEMAEECWLRKRFSRFDGPKAEKKMQS